MSKKKKKPQEILRIGDYVCFPKPKNKIEVKCYKHKIFQVYDYDNDKRLYKIKTIYPPIPANWISTKIGMTWEDHYNKWDSSRLKKLKVAKWLYGEIKKG